jgi:uncharacterized protein (TIGR02466 family)
MSLPLTPQFYGLWPTPFGVHRYAQADSFNPLLARVLGALRLSDDRADTVAGAPFYASTDDLLGRIRLPEWQGFLAFVTSALRQTLGQANSLVWPPQLNMQLQFEGMWFQMANQGASHDVHTHGNCSWSGVYCVQIDDTPSRTAHAVYGERNGATRFYGPFFQALGGAAIDRGNAYLQPPSLDVPPLAGQLLLFPSWLAHQALPYAGDKDRIIISFNVSVHSTTGNDRQHAYGAG